MCSRGLESKLSQIKFSLVFVPTTDTISSYTKAVCPSSHCFQNCQGSERNGLEFKDIKTWRKTWYNSYFCMCRTTHNHDFKNLYISRKVLHCHDTKSQFHKIQKGVIKKKKIKSISLFCSTRAVKHWFYKFRSITLVFLSLSINQYNPLNVLLLQITPNKETSQNTYFLLFGWFDLCIWPFRWHTL